MFRGGGVVDGDVGNHNGGSNGGDSGSGDGGFCSGSNSGGDFDEFDQDQMVIQMTANPDSCYTFQKMAVK